MSHTNLVQRFKALRERWKAESALFRAEQAALFLLYQRDPSRVEGITSDEGFTYYQYKEPQGAEPEASKTIAPRIIEAPGSRLMRLTAYLPGKHRLRRDIEQVVADMRQEHYDALDTGDHAEARRALLRGRIAIITAVWPSWIGAVASALGRWLGKLGH